MKLTASEFINKAEGLKSSEISVRHRLESIRTQRNNIQEAIETQNFRLQSLYLELRSLESEESNSGEDGEGVDNSAEIAAVMSEISSTQEQIEDYEQQDSQLRSEEAEANSELRIIEQQEQETLADIQDSATRTNQNIALISSFGGDYANVSAQAASSFQHNLGQLSQAAQILGGSVSMGSSAASGNGSKTSSNSGTSQNGGSQSNFYESANNQRKASINTGAMGAKGSGSTSTGRNGRDIYTSTQSDEESYSPKKSGGLGRKSKGKSAQTPLQALAEYMNAHNYGKDDYDTYSRDPEWQELHRNAFPDYYKKQESSYVVSISNMKNYNDSEMSSAIEKSFSVDILENQNDTDTQRFFNAIGWSQKRPMLIDEIGFSQLRDSIHAITLYHTDSPFGDIVDAAEYAKQFMATNTTLNDQYYSGGIHGDGTYFSTDSEGAWAYGWGKTLSTQYKAIFNQNAKLIDEYDLDLLVKNFKNSHPQSYEKLLHCTQGYGSGRTDGMKSIIAAINGYNIIISEGNFANEKYYTVLDRSAVTVCTTILHYGEINGNIENW